MSHAAWSQCAGHTASFILQYSVSNNAFGENIIVTNTSTTVAGETCIATWDFADGATGAGNYLQHHYSMPGFFHVRLINTWVSTSNTSNIICVDTFYNINTHVHICSRLGIFSSTVVGNTVQLNDTSSDYPGEIHKRMWKFGDDTSMVATGPSVSHTYAAPGTYQVVFANWWVDSLTQDTMICGDTLASLVTVSTGSGNVISGNIYKDSLTFSSLDSFKVWLITYNSATSLLTAVDSTIVTGPVAGVPYAFYNEPSGTYLVKAAKLNNSISLYGIVPTYHDSSIYWAAATNIVHTGGATVGQHIWMKNGIVLGGNGFISGNVNLGANKGTGAAVPNLLVYLRDNTNGVIQQTYTNQNGDYSFSSLPVGSYSVYPEEINYMTTPFNNVNITTSYPSQFGINFGMTATEINLKLLVLKNRGLKNRW